MNENLDLTKILKGCPKGTKFYSSYLGKNVIFIEIYDNHIKCEYSSQIDSLNCSIQFRKDGSLYPGGDCMLFPSKDQRDWSKWQRPFVDGDVAIYINRDNTKSMFIYKEVTLERKGYYSYCWFNEIYGVKAEAQYVGVLDNNVRLATEEEKQRLFKALKDNGYKWDPKTKTLEKLIVPKFKVGDKIRHRLTGEVYMVLFVLSNGCGGGVYDVAITNEIGKSIDVKEQDDYELVTNKFDITTLKPFDKVLVRKFDYASWCADLYSCYDECGVCVVCTSGVLYNFCIPYNNDTKHLVGKRDNAPEYYRYWEE